MTDYERLIRALQSTQVDFIVIGGVAANAHGLTRSTYDIDVVYSRQPANLDRLQQALSPLKPYLRGAPPGLPFRFDIPTIKSGLNFTLSTTAGDIDLLGEVAGGGSYEKLLNHSRVMSLFGMPCQCVDLDTLIHLKRAAGRPKDYETLALLEALREERERR